MPEFVAEELEPVEGEGEGAVGNEAEGEGALDMAL